MVQLEEVERLLGDGGTLQDRGATLLHEGQQPADPLAAAGRVVHLEQPTQALRLLRTSPTGRGEGRARLAGALPSATALEASHNDNDHVVIKHAKYVCSMVSTQQCQIFGTRAAAFKILSQSLAL